MSTNHNNLRGYRWDRRPCPHCGRQVCVNMRLLSGGIVSPIRAPHNIGECSSPNRGAKMPICLSDNKWACGCDILGRCDCEIEPFAVNKARLRRMTKHNLFLLYIRCLNDDMSITVWQGFTKTDILEMFLRGKNSAKLTPLPTNQKY